MQEKLSKFHTAILIYMTQSGIVVFSIPQMEAKYFGTNGWLILLPIFLLCSFNIFLISSVYRLGKGRSIFDILETSIPKALLIPLYCGLSALWTMIGCLVAKQYMLIFQMLAFPTTNPMIFKAVFDVLALLLLTKGIYNIGKASTIFFGLVIWLSFLLIYFFSDFEWVRITPFVLKGGHDSLNGFLQIYSAFLGYELSLLLFPYVNKNTRLPLAIQSGLMITTINYAAVSLISFGFFGYAMLAETFLPVIDLLAYIELPFVERLENLFYTFVLFSTIITFVMYVWAANESLQRVIPKVPVKWSAVFLIVAAFIVAFIPDVMSQVQSWLHFLTYIEIAVSFGLPLLLIVIILLSSTRKAHTHE
ncbi:GerAB/ArcD/ProY family transporter [Paenibacillus paridis]|uniref:GerAB/ArcD/ProY family transporter n=1 Tax=Paenibacillus paridis TaxID=2583376 RepID=UPI001122AF30|nr:GerAB/ArcD/ProY family transporter [Paenibacillus paridis]